MTEPDCRCPFVSVGTHKTESRNWNSDCPTHGVGTVWYETTGRERMRERESRTRRLIAESRRARRAARGDDD